MLYTMDILYYSLRMYFEITESDAISIYSLYIFQTLYIFSYTLKEFTYYATTNWAFPSG